MELNPVLEKIFNRKSIRSYTDQEVTEETLHTIVRAGQQAPFAYQLCSILLSRKREQNPFGAPLLFTICVDSQRFELIMERRGWKLAQNDLSLLLFGIQDAAYVAENMVIAAESLGMGSCFLGATPYHAEEIIEQYGLPKRVFPLIELAMGYPAEDPPVRPRYPLEFTLFEDRYPEFTEEQIREAMGVMDEGYLAQEYYRKANYIIPLEEGKSETYSFGNYSWTEHISRKVGQWLRSPEELVEQLTNCGFDLNFLNSKEKRATRD